MLSCSGHELGRTGEVYRFDRKPYEVGQSYRFAELPAGVQADALEQGADIEIFAGVPAEVATYRFIMVPHDELVRTMKERFGEAGYAKRLRSKPIRTLARTIERAGLQQPPILDEGIQRALALALLGWDMPYFTLDQILELPDPVYIPTLEGRRRHQA